ncbi:MAG: class I mannose-6-phosphate isomerase [Candidatus Spyradocola sp.]|jgi:mannose-6-phosphate isomerase
MNIYHQPWMLVPNHIRGKGGREIDKLRGVTPALDTDSGSEAWIGSVTRVGNPPPEAPNYGCSEVVLPDGRREFLFEAIAENPEEILGRTHMAKNGQGLGMLIKFLDAQAQYGLQCHPTRPWAKKMWNSPYGKEESWYVIGTRDDTAEPAYILLGFKEGVTRETWEEAYFRDDLKALEALCHKIPVQVGEAYFVGGGCPHALGEGCLVIEVQEPADITLGAHPYRAMPEAWKQKNPDVPAGLFDERLLGAYVYDGCTYDENLRR